MTAIFVIRLTVPAVVDVDILYGLPVYLIAEQGRRGRVFGIAASAAILTIVGTAFAGTDPSDAATVFQCGYALLLQGIMLALVIRNMGVVHLLVSQAKLLDETHDSVVLRGLDGKLLYWNRGASSLFGWTFEEARSRTQAELTGFEANLPPIPIDEFISLGMWHGEVAFSTKDGRQIIVDCSCSLINGQDGKPSAVLTTGNDVTERRMALDKMETSELRYRSVFQTTALGVWECDFSETKRRMDALASAGTTDLPAFFAEHPEAIREAIDSTVCLDVNQACVRMFDAQCREDLLGPVGWAWPAESEAEFGASIVNARLGVASFDSEVILNTLSGRQIHCFLSIALPPESASRASVFVTVADISAHREARNALQIANAELTQAMRLTSLGEMAASIAHEVNQPIGGMIASGQAGLRWLRRENPDLAAVETSLQQLVEEAKRVGRIVSGVRALARNELPTPVSLDLNQLIRETVALLDHDLKRHAVTVVTQLDRSLSPISADPTQIQQVLINLVLNAAQAVRDLDEPGRRITLTTEGFDQGVRVSVSDNGPGVPTEMKGSLFSPFKSTRLDGMGLGLSVCASIVKRHGGRIWLEEPEIGATFWFTIPMQPISKAPVRSDQPSGCTDV